ncbi:hypothetical protein UUU_26540 (plasmid) [Klebsiella pneumoniae subsp. pneumoniae DSM 30104 = JCM 1662 = NBRC 14940]|nr:hypothetical protein UUU_26540 [Klebsiella pneumoniae subsp. pneumoniae DSM 30104 = JCM 1662 = NBRC 14940]
MPLPAAIANSGNNIIRTATGITARTRRSIFRRVNLEKNDFFSTGAEAP